MPEPITVIPAPRQWNLEQNKEIQERVTALKQFDPPIDLDLTFLENLIEKQSGIFAKGFKAKQAEIKKQRQQKK